MDEGDIITDPSGRADGDTTTWLYDEATGMELKLSLIHIFPVLLTGPLFIQQGILK